MYVCIHININIGIVSVCGRTPEIGGTRANLNLTHTQICIHICIYICVYMYICIHININTGIGSVCSRTLGIGGTQLGLYTILQ